MNNRYAILSLLSLLYIVTINCSRPDAGIYECTSMAEIRELFDAVSEEDKNTWYCFDYDNTIAEPNGMPKLDPENHYQIGSDQWFNAVFDYYKGHPEECRGRSPIFMAMAANQIAQYCVHVHPVEEDMIRLISELNAAEIPTLSLTARSHPLRNITLKQMADLGIFFSLKTKKIRSLIFEPEQQDFLPAMLINGVLFCSDNHKGTMLSLLIRECVTNNVPCPKAIVCFDDKKHHLVNIQMKLQELNQELLIEQKNIMRFLEDGMNPLPLTTKAQIKRKYRSLLNFTPIIFVGIRYGKLDPKIDIYRQLALGPKSLELLRARCESPSINLLEACRFAAEQIRA